jgi:hypothetical protein
VADPSDISGNTFFFAGRAAVNTYAYVWWFFVHDSILSFFWQGFGVYGAGASLLCSLVIGAAVFLIYGLGRAFYEAETASQQPGAPLPTGSVFAPTLPAPPAPAGQHAGPPLFGAAPAAGVQRVIGNASLRLYHRPTCVWVDRIAPRHRADFDSAASAQAAGYRPCRVCAP